MCDDLLGCEYTDSREPVKKGDSVFVDGRGGRVDAVCLPESQLARHYSCERTGGLLIQFDDEILALLPFGHFHRITKRADGDAVGQGPLLPRTKD